LTSCLLRSEVINEHIQIDTTHIRTLKSYRYIKAHNEEEALGIFEDLSTKQKELISVLETDLEETETRVSNYDDNDNCLKRKS
jgi:hypothetical protein